jgi:hypothetical protein
MYQIPFIDLGGDITSMHLRYVPNLRIRHYGVICCSWLLSPVIMQFVRNYVSVLRIESQIRKTKAIQQIACVSNS